VIPQYDLHTQLPLVSAHLDTYHRSSTKSTVLVVNKQSMVSNAISYHSINAKNAKRQDSSNLSVISVISVKSVKTSETAETAAKKLLVLLPSNTDKPTVLFPQPTLSHHLRRYLSIRYVSA
jgi:hypothetical protein